MIVSVIDNYDSFVYNLCDYIGRFGVEVKVYRNDDLTPEEVLSEKPSAIVISPGPGRPSGAGISMDLIRKTPPGLPLLGVCLGHQALAEAFGGRVVGAERILHGKVSSVRHNGEGIFSGIKNPFEATRYHSLIVEKKSLPEIFEVTATTCAEEIMGIKHKELPLYGVQFHPESVITEHGIDMIRNFLSLAGFNEIS